MYVPAHTRAQAATTLNPWATPLEHCDIRGHARTLRSLASSFHSQFRTHPFLSPAQSPPLNPDSFLLLRLPQEIRTCALGARASTPRALTVRAPAFRAEPGVLWMVMSLSPMVRRGRGGGPRRPPPADYISQRPARSVSLGLQARLLEASVSAGSGLWGGCSGQCRRDRRVFGR